MSVEEAEPPQYIITAPGEEKNENDDDDDKSSTTSNSTATQKSDIAKVNKTTQNTRSQSLQSASTSTIAFDQPTVLAVSLTQQHKALSSMNIVSEKHVQKFSSSQTTSSSAISTSITGTKSKFTSFLQQPDSTSTSLHGSTYLTAQQKHVRQFVRSTSAHSSTESTTGASISMSGKSDKCIRSTSQQIDDQQHGFIEQSKGLKQSAAILISKSAETIEGGFRSCSSTSGSMRQQLTLSGGFLAPPNRKLTILSPIHAPPGLQELLRKHRSPLSPRISFPGTEAAELFP